MSHAATVGRGARGFVLAGALFLPAAAAAAAVGAPRSTVVALGLYGFVLHTVFGKAYSLVPSYFDRTLTAPRAPWAHLPMAALGAAALAVPAEATVLGRSLAALRTAGALLWASGAAVFLGAICWTVCDNPTGAETGTADAEAERARVDRVANAFVPVAFAALALGAVETAAVLVDWPSLSETRLAGAHLLAVGTAAVLVFAVGARLLPRLLSAQPPEPLVWTVLPAGALGAASLVAGFAAGGSRTLFSAAALSLGVAVVAHAALVAVLLSRAPRPRVGAYGVFAGAVGGVVTVAVGASVALGWAPGLAAVHPRLGLFGFLGLTILGVAYHFYPPAIAGAYGDRTAAASIVLVGGGLLAELVGIGAGVGALSDAGRWAVVVGGVLYVGLLVTVFARR